MLRGQLRLDGAIVGRHKDLLGAHIRRCLAQSTLALPAALEQLGEHAWGARWPGHQAIARGARGSRASMPRTCSEMQGRLMQRFNIAGDTSFPTWQLAAAVRAFQSV